MVEAVAELALDDDGSHVRLAASAPPGTLDRLDEPLSEHSDARGPVEHAGGDRPIYVEDPEGNVVEVWDFFERAQGARHGVGALG